VHASSRVLHFPPLSTCCSLDCCIHTPRRSVCLYHTRRKPPCFSCECAGARAAATLASDGLRALSPKSFPGVLRPPGGRGGGGRGGGGLSTMLLSGPGLSASAQTNHIITLRHTGRARQASGAAPPTRRLKRPCSSGPRLSPPRDSEERCCPERMHRPARRKMVTAVTMAL
jgi:hypothetical protein